MESGYLADFSKKYRRKYQVIFVVSDHPISRPFYKVLEKIPIDINLIIKHLLYETKTNS